MSVFEEYPYLPGQTNEFRDGNLDLRNDPAPAGTDSILFLGTAVDGPLKQPVRVTPQNVRHLFGNDVDATGRPNGATLVSKFEDAWRGGSRDIRLMRVTGKSAKLDLLGRTLTESTEPVTDEKLGEIKGNNSQAFILQHGNIDLDTVQVTANGATLAPTMYSISAGDETEKGILEVFANVTRKGATVRVAYTHETEEGEVAVGPYQSDDSGDTMTLPGDDDIFTLAHTPTIVYELRADGILIDPSRYIIDTASKTIEVLPTSSIAPKAVVEVRYSYLIVTTKLASIRLDAAYPGELYNETSGEVQIGEDDVTVIIEKPNVKKSLSTEIAMRFHSEDVPTFRHLVNAINAHPENNAVIRAHTDFGSEETSTLSGTPKTFFSGGDDGIHISKQEMYEALGGTVDEEGELLTEGAYQILENYNVDFVIPLGVYLDDKLNGRFQNFGYQLALACAVMSHYNDVTMGQISTSSPLDITLKGIEEHTRRIESMQNWYHMRDQFGNVIYDNEDRPIDLGQFMHVVAGPDLITRHTRLGPVGNNDAAVFAGFVTTLDVHSSPMNKIIQGVEGLRYEYSAHQLNRLSRQRFITFREQGGRAVVTDSMTAASPGSDYGRTTTVRIVKKAVNQVREATRPYLGEANDTGNRNAMTAAIAKRLDKMVDDGELLGHDFQVIASPQMELMGEANVELGLQTPSELRKLTTIVSLM